MIPEQSNLSIFFNIAEMCERGQRSISVATRNRRSAIIAARDEIQRLRIEVAKYANAEQHKQTEKEFADFETALKTDGIIE